MMKKFITLLSLFLAVITARAYDFEVDGIYYEITSESSKTVMVTISDKDISGDLVIPETVNYGGIEYSVTEIDDWAYSQCNGLTSVTIPDSVLIIGEGAFFLCVNLTNVNFGSSVTTIGKSSFMNCGLTTITIPNSVITIEDSAFYSISSLQSLTIGSSVTTIGEKAFMGCKITSGTVAIPESVTTIGAGAFGSFSLTEINVAENNPVYASIDGVLFSKDYSTLIQYPCGRAGNYEIPDGVTTIVDGAFTACDGLISVIIPNSVIVIG